MKTIILQTKKLFSAQDDMLSKYLYTFPAEAIRLLKLSSKIKVFIKLTELMNEGNYLPYVFLHENLPYIQYQFTVPILRIITFIGLVAFIFNLNITVIYFIFNWDIHHFIRIAHSQSIEVFAAISSYMGLFTIDMGFQVDEFKKKLWLYDEVGSEVSERIKKKNELLRYTRALLTAYGLLAAIICIPLSGDDGEFTVFSIIKGDMEIPRIISKALSIMMVFVKMYNSYVVISMNYITLFVINDLTSNMLLLRKKLQSISKLYGEEDENYYDESYQRNINKILRNCIFQHKTILKYAKLVKTRIEDVMLIVTIVGVLCLAFLYIKAKMEKQIRFIINCILMQGMTVVLVCSYCNSGQLLMDECENLHRDLCQCPWILWNQSNKVNYQIFLMNSNEPVVIQSLNVVLNNHLIVVVLQRVLSFMAFIEQVSVKP